MSETTMNRTSKGMNIYEWHARRTYSKDVNENSVNLRRICQKLKINYPKTTVWRNRAGLVHMFNQQVITVFI